MAIPTCRELRSPVATVLREAGRPIAAREIIDVIARDSRRFGLELTQDDMEKRDPAGGRTFDHRVHSTLQVLKRARPAVIEGPVSGKWALAGQEIPSVVGEPVARERQPGPLPPVKAVLRELVAAHLQEVRASLSERIARLSPDQFEELVAQFLVRLGYLNVRRTGGPGDRNVDVTGSYAPPFMEVPVRVQVKHKQHGATVGPTDVAAFRDRAGGVGHALLMVTNERLTGGALETASEQGRQRVHVLQGDSLVDGMIDERIGVKEGPFGLLEIDEEFFAQF